MPSLIGALRISLGLETAAFEKGTKRASAEIDAFGSKAEKAGFAIGRLTKTVVAGGALLAGSAIFSKMQDLVTSSLEYAGSLKETADQLGVTTKTLQAYRKIGEASGVEIGKMDNVLAKLTKTLGDAAGGAKKQAEAFEKLGINAKAFQATGKDVGELFPLMAQGLAKLGSDSERAAVLGALLGKSWKDVGSIMSMGGKGINDARTAAEKGILTEEQIDKADRAADSITRLKRTLNEGIAGVVSNDAGAIGQLADKLNDLAEKAFKAWKELERLRNTPVGKFLSGFFGNAVTQMGPFGAIGTALEAIDQSTKPRAPASAAPGAVRPGQRPSVILPKARIDPRFLQGPTSSILRNTRLGEMAMSPFGDFEPGRFAGGIALITSELKRGQAEWDELGLDLPQVNTTLGEFVDQMGETIPNLTGLTGLFGDLAGAGEELKGDLSRAFTDIILHGASFGDAMLNVFDRFLSKLLDNVFNSLLDGGGGGGIFGALFGGGSGAGLFGLLGFASGTSYAPRGLAVVGEKGPELVNFRGGERVWPNGTGPAGMGGNVYNFSGNLLTPEFWARIQAMDAAAANAGSDLAMRKSAHRQSRSLLFS